MSIRLTDDFIYDLKIAKYFNKTKADNPSALPSLSINQCKPNDYL